MWLVNNYKHMNHDLGGNAIFIVYYLLYSVLLYYIPFYSILSYPIYSILLPRSLKTTLP